MTYPVHINTLQPKESTQDTNALIRYGMCTNVSNENLCRIDNDDLSRLRLNLFKVVDKPQMKTYSCFIYNKGLNVRLIQKDTDITNLLIGYDKVIRDICIAISFEESKYEELKHILKSKYNYDFYLPKDPDYAYEKRKYEELVEDINNHNNKMNEAQKNGIFNFVSLKKVPFTFKFYENQFTPSKI